MSIFKGSISSVVKDTFGVLKMSMLGPLLFLECISDVPLVVSSTIGLFSYDTLIYQVIKSTEDNTALQRDLDALVTWK